MPSNPFSKSSSSSSSSSPPSSPPHLSSSKDNKDKSKDNQMSSSSNKGTNQEMYTSTAGSETSSIFSAKTTSSTAQLLPKYKSLFGAKAKEQQSLQGQGQGQVRWNGKERAVLTPAQKQAIKRKDAIDPEALAVWMSFK